MKDTIATISTPLISAAIHIVRICGPESYSILKKITKNKIIEKGYEIQKCLIWDNEEIIDDVIILKFVGPRSYNGEDLIEINCHGGPLVTKKILGLLIKNGARLSENGEFTKIAFLNNKLTLNQTISINNLINAKTEKARSIATGSLVKKNYSLLNKISESLFKIIGNIEVNIDYPEYDDVEQVLHNDLLNKIETIKQNCQNLVKAFKISQKIFKGYNICIIGKPNVGKSSLLNALLKENRAIVSNIPGTTRDPVNESIILNGILLNIIDTAGIRKAENKIEKIGIKKTMELIERSDLLIFVINNSKKISDDEKTFLANKKLKNKKIIIAKNKSDLNKQYNNDINGVLISAKNDNIENLITEIHKELNYEIDINNYNELISDQQVLEIENVIQILERIIKQANNKDPIDLITVDIQKAHEGILKITGEYKDFDFYEKLFQNFCIGK